MDKKQVMAFLGKSDRMVSKYVSQGWLVPTYEKGRTRDKAIYDEAQVQMLKDKLEARAARPPRPQRSLVRRPPNTQSGALEHQRPTPPPEPGTAPSLFLLSPAQLEQLLRRSDVPLKDKLVLCFADAAKLSGFPQRALRAAAKRGELRAIKVGRGQAVHQDDLAAWVKKQFS